MSKIWHLVCTFQLAALFATGCSEQRLPAPSGPVSTAYSNPTWDRPPKVPKFTIDLPLLDEFLSINGASDLGLRFHNSSELEHWDYHCTPKDSLTFAWTSGDGEHFCLLAIDNRIDENSPVVLSAPANSNDENRLIATSFRNFLRLGLRRGFIGLSEFAYRPEDTVAAYGNAAWEPTEEWHSDYFIPDERQQEILDSIAKSLNLEPISYTTDEFASMQDQLKSLVDLNADESATLQDQLTGLQDKIP